MKSIKNFNKNSIGADSSKIFGGNTKVYKTEAGLPGGCGDTWYDNDEDGKISNGDTICFEVCV
ncbi:hypothetical protein [Tenacibaculum xiamenense]|uniref:hypothetical protein n=1 Tax=Tenacibaculum xiamenense TaxID=1261553 RepID=UPI003896017D